MWLLSCFPLYLEKSWLLGNVPSDGRNEDPGNYRPVSLTSVRQDHRANPPGRHCVLLFVGFFVRFLWQSVSPALLDVRFFV